MENYDAILRNWSYHPIYTGSIIGDIFDDSTGRFVDGQTVITSTVQSHIEDIVKTRNSVYKLEDKYNGS